MQELHDAWALLLRRQGSDPAAIYLTSSAPAALARRLLSRRAIEGCTVEKNLSINVVRPSTHGYQ
jgi:hypothetical protein